MERLADALKTRRLELGLTQEHIARQLGVRQSTIARWETGARIPAGALMVKLCRLLRLSWDEVA